MNRNILPRLAPRPSTLPHLSKVDTEFETKCKPGEAYNEDGANERISWRMPLVFKEPRPHPESFTEESSILKVQLGKRKAGGRPPSESTKRRRRALDPSQPTPPRPTRLRKNKPVKAPVNYDVWTEILSWTEPATLFKIRNTCKAFRDILSRESLWEKARIHTYGPEMPEPPAGMTNSQYLEMINGNKCQVCGATPIRKVYWAFLKRWCNECYRKKTIREREAKVIMPDNMDMLWSLMHATRDSWTNYVQAGFQRNRLSQNQNYTPCWLHDDVTKLKADYDAWLQTLPDDITPEEKEAKKLEFGRDRIDKTKALLDHVKRIEQWQSANDSVRFSDYKTERSKREAYYIQKAESADPPIPRGLLEQSKAYQRFKQIPKPPSERSWELLLMKIREGN